MCIGNNFSNIFCSLMIYLIINRCILKVFLTKILIFIPIYENILIYATKKSLIYNQGLKRADDGNRTRDLRLTKATLYRLSQGSTSLTPIYYIVNIQNCQVKIKNFCGLQHEPSLVFTLLFPDCNSASRTRYIVRPGRRSYILFFQAAVFPCSYFRRAPTSLYRADSRCLSA